MSAPQVDLDRNVLDQGPDKPTIKLERREAEILSYLLSNACRLVSKLELFEAVYGKHAIDGEVAMLAFICHLRRKLSRTNIAVLSQYRRGYCAVILKEKAA